MQGRDMQMRAKSVPVKMVQCGTEKMGEKICLAEVKIDTYKLEIRAIQIPIRWRSVPVDGTEVERRKMQ